MKHVITLCLLLLGSDVFATWQIRDRITVESKEKPIYASPLADYLWIKGKSEFYEAESSACWRGYQAHWLIKENQLFLLKVTHCHESTEHSLEELFGKEVESPIPATWFSGYISTPGDSLFSDNRSYREYPEYIDYYQIDSGRVVRTGQIYVAYEFVRDIIISDMVVDPHVVFDGTPLREALVTTYELFFKNYKEYGLGEFDDLDIEKIRSIDVRFEIDDSLEEKKIDLELKDFTIERILHFVTGSIDAYYNVTFRDKSVVIEIFPKKKTQQGGGINSDSLRSSP